MSLTNVNEAPTAVTFTNATTSLAENTSTASRIKVADIGVTDDGLGTNVLSLSGTDFPFFEIDNNVLYLKAGTALDYETKSAYQVTVEVDDAALGNTPDATQDFTLAITAVNNPPTAVTFTNATTSLAENTSTASRIKVADIGVTDDGLGTNVLSLSGTDFSFFEIDNNVLCLKAGTALDYETKSAYQVTVNADDTSVGGTPDASQSFTLSLSDIPEFVNAPPTLAISYNDADGILRKGEKTVLTFDFSELVFGFNRSDITLSPSLGMLGSLVQDTLDPTVYRATFTPSSNVTGVLSIAVGTGYMDAGSLASYARKLVTG